MKNRDEALSGSNILVWFNTVIRGATCGDVFVLIHNVSSVLPTSNVKMRHAEGSGKIKKLMKNSKDEQNLC